MEQGWTCWNSAGQDHSHNYDIYNYSFLLLWTVIKSCTGSNQLNAAHKLVASYMLALKNTPKTNQQQKNQSSCGSEELNACCWWGLELPKLSVLVIVKPFPRCWCELQCKCRLMWDSECVHCFTGLIWSQCFPLVKMNYSSKLQTPKVHGSEMYRRSCKRKWALLYHYFMLEGYFNTVLA